VAPLVAHLKIFIAFLILAHAKVMAGHAVLVKLAMSVLMDLFVINHRSTWHQLVLPSARRRLIARKRTRQVLYVPMGFA